MTTVYGDQPIAGRVPWRADARIVAWWILLGAGAGGVMGLLLGGICGRLLMLILRLQSPGAVGLDSDDGFEIGRVTLDSLNLVVGSTMLGAAFGAGYMILRLGLPAWGRVAAAALLGATAGGALFIVPDGTDLSVLDPLWLAVSGFVALPALAAGATAAIVEHMASRAPWSISRRQALAFSPALLAAPLAPLLALGGAAAMAVRRSGRLRPLATPARVAVGILVVAVIVVSGVELLREVDQVF